MSNTVGSRRSPYAWRVVDIVVASVLAVACGLIFWFWSVVVYPAVDTATVGFPPAAGLTSGGWLIAGVLGGLVIRRPGAALYCEMVAAVLEGLLGTHFGFLVLVSGFFQGIGAELVFAAFAYRRFGLVVSLLSGTLSGAALALNENVLYNYEWSAGFQLAYVLCAAVSGLVIAGLLSWLLVRGLVRTGVLDSVAAGRDARRARTAA